MYTCYVVDVAHGIDSCLSISSGILVDFFSRMPNNNHFINNYDRSYWTYPRDYVVNFNSKQCPSIWINKPTHHLDVSMEQWSWLPTFSHSLINLYMHLYLDTLLYKCTHITCRRSSRCGTNLRIRSIIVAKEYILMCVGLYSQCCPI